jgi:hypothetical protein
MARLSDRDAIVCRYLVRGEAGDLRVDPRAAAPPGRRDLDQSARTGAQADEGRGIAVAQDRARAGGENGGHPAALHRQAAMAYGVHARVHDVQPPAL